MESVKVTEPKKKKKVLKNYNWIGLFSISLIRWNSKFIRDAFINMVL